MILDNLLSQEKAVPFIIVMPDGHAAPWPPREFQRGLSTNITDFERVGKARARLRFYPSGYDVPNQGVRVPFGEFMTQSGYVFNRCLKDMRIAVAAPDVGVDVLMVTKAGGCDGAVKSNNAAPSRLFNPALHTPGMAEI